MPKPNDKIGDYTLKSKIGRGAFGVVWLAEKEGLISTEFALKIPNEFDVDLALVEREAVLWKKASGHPNVLPIIEAKIYDEQVVIVSEYVSGGTLQDLLDKLKADNQILDTEKSVELISGILNGLQHLHSKSIIHQDLKPANILLQGDTPRLTDFGISGTLSSKSYMPGTLGTYPYMSPETFRERRSVQTDIWAAGVIFYQLLSGNLPFPQQDTPSVMNAVINDNVPPLPESIPKSLRNIVEKALQKNTELRYKSVLEMRQVVRESQSPALLLPTVDSTPNLIKTLPAPRPDVPSININSSLDAQLGEFPKPKKRKSKVWSLVLGTTLLAILLIAGVFAIMYNQKGRLTVETPPNNQSNSANSVNVVPTIPSILSNQSNISNTIRNANITTNSNSVVNTNVSPTPSVDVTGTWIINMKFTNNSVYESKQRMKQIGENIKIEEVNFEDENGENFVEQKDGKINGDKISFYSDSQSPDPIHLIGSTTKYAMKGVHYTHGEKTGTWTARRQ